MHEFHLAAEIIKPRRTRQVMFFDMFSRPPTSRRQAGEYKVPCFMLRVPTDGWATL
jgi:hypothetical protein